MAESSANLLFHGHHGFHMEGSWNGHGMVNSIWIPLIPYGIWAYPPWIPWNKSRWIPWNSAEIPYGKHQLSKIASAWRIEPLTPRHVTCVNEQTILQLHHVTIKRQLTDLNRFCCPLVMPKCQPLFFLNHHHHHPQCPPITALPPHHLVVTATNIGHHPQLSTTGTTAQPTATWQRHVTSHNDHQN